MAEMGEVILDFHLLAMKAAAGEAALVEMAAPFLLRALRAVLEAAVLGEMEEMSPRKMAAAAAGEVLDLAQMYLHRQTSVLAARIRLAALMAVHMA